jgi:hypothetical protein
MLDRYRKGAGKCGKKELQAGRDLFAVEDGSGQRQCSYAKIMPPLSIKQPNIQSQDR